MPALRSESHSVWALVVGIRPFTCSEVQGTLASGGNARTKFTATPKVNGRRTLVSRKREDLNDDRSSPHINERPGQQADLALEVHRPCPQVVPTGWLWMGKITPARVYPQGREIPSSRAWGT